MSETDKLAQGMTLKDVRDWHRGCQQAAEADGHDRSAECHKELADAIDAHLAHASAQPAQPASVAEPVAWMHDTKGDAFVISDVVKQLWLKAKPENVEHYTVPLYTHPQPQSAMAQESGDGE